MYDAPVSVDEAGAVVPGLEGNVPGGRVVPVDGGTAVTAYSVNITVIVIIRQFNIIY